MEIAKIIYLGNLRTEATHLKSGKVIITDAPTDNQGKGDAFSPTDLLATSLGNCMLTIMGIDAAKKGIRIGQITLKIGKVMAANPRRVGRINVLMDIEDPGYTEEEKSILETAALNCPVAKSLHPDIEQDITFLYHPL